MGNNTENWKISQNERWVQVLSFDINQYLNKNQATMHFFFLYLELVETHTFCRVQYVWLKPFFITVHHHYTIMTGVKSSHRLTSCSFPLSSPGGEALHDFGVQMSRRQRVMQRSDLLAGHGRLQAHWRPPSKEVQRRRAGGRQPVRHWFHCRAHTLQTTQQEWPGVLRRLARLLHTGPRVRWTPSILYRCAD